MGGLKNWAKENIGRRMSRFRHKVREEGRRFCSVLLCASMVVSNLSTGSISAYASTTSDGVDLYFYEMESESLYEALQTAVSEGNTLDEDLEFMGEWADDYAELLEADGSLYELEPEMEKDKERDKKLGLRVFARIQGDIGLEEEYELDGTEEFIFLVTNETEKDQAAAIIVDEKISEVMLVVPGSSIPVDTDVDVTAEIKTSAPAGPSTGGGSGSAGGGSGAGNSAAGENGKVNEISAEEAAMTEESESGTEDKSAEGSAADDDVDADGTGSGTDGETDGEATNSGEAADAGSTNGSGDTETGDPAKSNELDGAGIGNEGNNNATEGSSAENSSGNTSDADTSDVSGSGSTGNGGSSGEESSGDENGSGESSGGSSDAGSSNSENGSDGSGSSDGGSGSDGSGSSDGGSGSDGSGSSDGGSSDSGSSDDGGSSDNTSLSSISLHKTALLAAGKASASDALKLLAKASASDATPSDADYILDGTLYEAVRLDKAGAVAFITTAADLGLESEDLEYHFEASDGGIHAEVELADGLDPDTLFVIERKSSAYNVSIEMTQEYMQEKMDIPSDGRSYIVLDMHFTDQDGNEISVDSEADIRLSFDHPIKIVGDDIQAMHISHITHDVEDVMEEVAMDNSGAVEELALHATGFSTTVITYYPDYEDTDLANYADSLFGEDGSADVASLTVSQIPSSGTILSGETVAWNLTVGINGNSNFKYEGFIGGSYDQTLYSTLDSLSVTLNAPGGITIKRAYTGGLDYVISGDGSAITIDFGTDIDASSETYTSVQVYAVVDSDPAPATGTEYQLMTDDVYYTAVVTAVDRNNSDAAVATYIMERNTKSEVSSLTTKTSDTWTISKKESIAPYTATVEGTDYVVAAYEVGLAINGSESWSTYYADGRVGFASLSLTDIPTITGADGTTVYYPSRITVTPKNFTGNSITAEAEDSEDLTQIDLSNLYATNQTSDFSGATSDEITKLQAIDSTLPIYSTYTVTVYYENVFGSTFYAVDSYTVENTINLAYTLDYAEDTDPVTDTGTDSVSSTYEAPTKAATLNLNKYITSIFGGGNYVTGTTLDEDYTGTATFTITDESGESVSLYILDDDGSYQLIENVITFERGAMLVTTADSASSTGLLAMLAALLGSSSAEEYSGVLYLNSGTYYIEETDNSINNTTTGSMQASGTTLTADGSGYTFTVDEGDSVVINADNVEKRGSVSFTKTEVSFDGTSTPTGLAGAEFTLYSDETCSTAVATATSGTNGTVTFSKLAPGEYYVKETGTPENYLTDETVYKVTVTANATTSTLTAADESGTTTTSVSNRANTANATFIKYLLSVSYESSDDDEDDDAATSDEPILEQVAVDTNRLSLFDGVFRLQVSVDGGDTWLEWSDFADGDTTYSSFGLTRTQTGSQDDDEETGSIGISENSYWTLSSLPVYINDKVTTPYYYRVVETLPEDYSAISIGDNDTFDTLSDGGIATQSFTLVNDGTTVALTNRTTGEISVLKEYRKTESNGVQLYIPGDSDNSYPEITGYLCVDNGDGTYTAIGYATTQYTTETSDSGQVTEMAIATLSGIDLLDDSGTAAQKYYWAEPLTTDGYTYVLEDGITADVIVDGDTVEMYVSSDIAYASAYDSANQAVTLTNILPYRRVHIKKSAVYGTADGNANGEYLNGAKYAVYRVVDGAEESTAYTSGTISNGSTGVNLVLEAGYVYHIYETELPEDTSGLKNRYGEDIPYITIDLTEAYPFDSSTANTSITDVNNYLYDEPYRKVELVKYLVSGLGTETLDGDAEFTVYRSATGEEGTYELYSGESGSSSFTGSYTANSEVSLVPGYYYVFVEEDRDGILSPDIYTGKTSEELLLTFTDTDGDTHTGFTTGLLAADTSLYSMETVYNYQNLGAIEIQKIVAGSSGIPLADAQITITYYTIKESEETIISLLISAVQSFLTGSSSDEYEEHVVTLTTGSDGKVSLEDLPVYDSDGSLIIYYITESVAPDGYFLNESTLTATLTPNDTTTVDMDGSSLIIEDEPEVTVTVQVTWEDCSEKDGQSESGGASDLQSYLEKLEGATVAAYKKVTADDGTVTWEYVAYAVSDETGYATFTGLSRTEEYVFILVDSGVTSESTTDSGDTLYPLYASEDGSLKYLSDDYELDESAEDLGLPQTLTDEELASYSYNDYVNAGETSKTFNSDSGTNLNNHLLYTQVHVFKYCTVSNGHDSSTLATISDADGEEKTVAAVNGSSFALYRQLLSDDEIAALENGESIELSYSSSMDYIGTYESGAGGLLGQLDFNAVTYGEMYVYWLVETSPAAGHTWPEGTTYYRILLYADNWEEGQITSEDATASVAYTKNEVQSFNVPNVHNPGSPHEYFRTYLYMNKWQSSYDEYGEIDTDNDSPLGGASFVFQLSNTDQTNTIDLMNGQSTTSMSAKNSLGYLNPGAIYFTELFNDWLVAILNDSGYDDVKSIADIEVKMLEQVSDSTWDKYSGMLFAATMADEPDFENLNDLADYYPVAGSESGETKRLAWIFLDAYKTAYPTGWSVSNMENVMSQEVSPATLGGTYGFKGYFAHIIFYEDAAPANYLKNTAVYEIYLQFKSTGANGSANTRYFWLDKEDKSEDATIYYSEDPGGIGDTVPLDESLADDEEKSNLNKVEITNLPDPEYSVTITKYGYELNGTTVGMTDDELDDYFTGTASGSQRTALKDTTFVLQRYDSTEGEWKYFSYTAKTSTTNAVFKYVTDSSEAMTVTTNSNGYVVESLPIGYYRLIETDTQDAYEAILDGSTVDGEVAARYFWVKNSDTGNSVNVYDPLKVNLTVEKDTLSSSGVSTAGTEITLTDVTDAENVYTGTVSGSGTVSFNTITAGTYTVTETVNSSSLTDAYFEPFTITIGYERAANEDGEVYVSGLLMEMTDAKGADCSSDDADTIAKGDGYTDIVLTIHNPVTGQLTVYKRDALANNTPLLTAGTYAATFKLYYMPFTVFQLDDAYIPDLSEEYEPAFDLTTWEEDGWTEVTDGEKTTTGGSAKFTNLVPGWYAVVETSAPTYYELADPVICYVEADMTEGHVYTDNEVNVYDKKKTTLTIRKNFELSDFFSEMVSEAKNYYVTIGLYVKTTDDEYISASSLGLVDSNAATRSIRTQYTSGTMVYNTSWWYQQLVQMGASLNSDGTYTVTASDGTVYTLDGYYYVKEDSIYNKSSGTDREEISDRWWLSNVTFTESSVGTTTVTPDDEGYCKLSGFSANHTGTVTFTNNYGYAKVIVQKVGNNNTILTGAEFKVYADEDQTTEITGATCTDNGDGSYTIMVPVTSLETSTYYIYESVAPAHYTLLDTPITVELKSGDIKSYGSDDSLIMVDNNGVNVILVKYDNIYANRSKASLLDGVTFTLFRREKVTDEDGNVTEEWGDWLLVEDHVTGTNGNSSGIVVFDTVSIDPDSYQYMLIETDWDTDNYVGLESLYHAGSAIEAVDLSDVTLTDDEGNTYSYSVGYILDITTADIGTDYTLTAYNTPILDVTFKKRGIETGVAAPHAAISAYRIDDTYAEGQELTQDEIADLINNGTLTASGTTSGNVRDGEYYYSSKSLKLPAGTYLVVETSTSSGYVINKEDSREVWYQIVKITVPSDGTAVTIDTPFVNVTEDYSVLLAKTGTADDSEEGDLDLTHDMLEQETEITYELTAEVTSTGPINNLVLSDDGLLVTDVWIEVGSELDSNIQPVDETTGKAYLAGNYSITSVKIPTDASYEYENLVFESGDKDSFTPQIWVSVTFTYSDREPETQSALLSQLKSYGEDTWTVTPFAENAETFTITWYDLNLKDYTGYDLGSGFVVSDAGNAIEVATTIDQQASGNTDYSAVAKFKNTATVTYEYTSWSTSGDYTDSSASATAAAVSRVPNVESPILSIAKSVTNNSSNTRNQAGMAIIGDSLTYTLTLTNTSTSLGMDNPVLVDLLPQGINIDAATESAFAAAVQIASQDEYSDLNVKAVSVTTQDGYTLLVIYLEGTLAQSGSVTLTLEGSVGSSVVNYLTGKDSLTLTNTAYVTSEQQGTIYSENAIGSVFRGTVGEWATNSSLDSLTKSMLGGFEGYGYLKATVGIELTSTLSVNVLKEIQGDKSEEWYSTRSTGAGVTANNKNTEEDDDKGYANFRLTIYNADITEDLFNIVMMDIIPKAGSYDFYGDRTSKWDLDYDSITSVKLDGETVDSSLYTIWYYTEEIKDQTAANTMKEAITYAAAWTEDTAPYGWTIDEPENNESITAFVIVFDSTVLLKSSHSLVVTYKTVPDEMSSDEITQYANNATWNSFSIYYNYVSAGSSDYTNPSTPTSPLTSNQVFALLQTESVKVGGMFWIDADGDGEQDSEDVTEIDSSSFDYIDYNERENQYAGYAAVQALLDTAKMQLYPYTGAQLGTIVTDNTTGTAMWRYEFDDLNTANLADSGSDEDSDYDSDGILYSRLVGSAQASTYLLHAVVEGNVGIKYKLTQARSTGTNNPVVSYNPESLYGENSYSNYWDFVLRDSNFTSTSTGITTGSLTADSERFFLYATSVTYDLSKDIGLVLYRDLEINKTDTLGNPVSGITFKVYGPYASGDASDVTGVTGLTSVEVTTDTDGKAKVEDLLYFQEYIIVEESTEGYSQSATTGSGTNITKHPSIDGAWILNIPTDDESYTTDTDSDSYDAGKAAVTDPTAYNTEDTDHIGVVNALETGTLQFAKTESSEIDETNGMAVSGATFTLTNNSTTVEGAWSSWVSSIMAKTLTDEGKAEIAAMGIANVTVNNDGSISFTTSFDEETVTSVNITNLPDGSYTLEETKAADGYELSDPSEWTFTVSADETTIDLEDDTIINTYSPSGKIILEVEKIEKNYESSDTKYTFNVYEADEDWSVTSKEAVATATVTGATEGYFSTITYDKEGTYYYIVEEAVPEDTNYITYDEAKYYITVDVSDSSKHNGTLVATVTGVSYASDGTADNAKVQVESRTDTTYQTAFTNKYEAGGSLTINVGKEVVDSSGNTYTSDKRSDDESELVFTFRLMTGSVVIDEVTITGADLFGEGGTGIATAAFDEISYDITDVNKTFTYTLSETVETDDEGSLPAGYSQNTESYTIVVTLTDNGDGTLTPSYTIKKAGSTTTTEGSGSTINADYLKFTNVYSPSGTASLTVGKKLNGGSTVVNADEFEVEIRQLTLNNGYPYQEPVSVETENGTVTVMEWVSDDSGTTALIGSDATATFTGTNYSNFNYTAAGTYWYLVTEVSSDDSESGYRYDTTEYLVAIPMDDQGDGTLKATSILVCTWDGSYFTPVTDTDGVDGADLTFNNYTTTEFSVSKLWSDSTDANDTRPDTVTVQLQRSTDDSEFWTDVGVVVELSDENSWEYSWDDLDQYDEDGDEYTYRAVELDANSNVVEDGSTIGGENGSTYQAAYEDITDEEDTEEVVGTSITNTIVTGELTVSKSVTGSGSATQEFTFTVVFTMTDDEENESALAGDYGWTKTGASDDDTTSGTTGSLLNGRYTFTLQSGESITFTGLPTGTDYVVTEASVTGYQTSWSGAEGTISTSGSTAAFTNYYATGTQEFTGTKTISGMSADSPEMTFNYLVEEETEDETTEVATGTVNVSSAESNNVNVSFGTVSYTLEDLDENGTATKTYIISEVIPGGAGDSNVYNGITYDKTKYIVTVLLQDNGKGRIVSTVTNVMKVTTDKDGEKTEDITKTYDTMAAFTNEYHADGSATIRASKYLDGGNITDEDTLEKFSFTLVEGTVDEDTGEFTESEDSRKKSAVYNGTISEVTFGLTYGTSGTYWYKLTENSATDYLNDSTVYYVKVVVEDEHDGTLSATKTYYEGGISEDNIISLESDVEFNNYTPTSFTVTKEWVDDTEDDRPTSVYVILMRRISGRSNDYERVYLTDEDGNSYLAVVELTTDNWTYIWENCLEQYVAGDASQVYEYTAVEAVADSTDTDGYTELSSGAVVDSLSGENQYTVGYGDVTSDSSSGTSAITISNTMGGTFRVRKTIVNNVSGTADSGEFTIKIDWTNAKSDDDDPYSADKSYADAYEWAIQNKNGTVADSGSKEWAAEWTFTLKDGQTLEIYNLPIGTQYKVYEDLSTAQSTMYVKSFMEYVSDFDEDDGTAYTEGDAGTISEETANAAVEVINTYTASGSLTLSVEKTENYYGASLTDESRKYTFNLYEASVNDSGDYEMSGTALSATVNLTDSDDTSGKSEFDAITYKDVEGTYYYIVEEEIPVETAITYDTAQYWIEVVVADTDHNGVLTAMVTKVTKVVTTDSVTTKTVEDEPCTTYGFTNEYEASGTKRLAVTKEVRYGSTTGDLYDDLDNDLTFNFTLTETTGGEADIESETITITAAELKSGGGTNTKEFTTELNYTADDIGSIHTYTVEETTQSANGFTLDTRVYTVTITVNDSGNTDHTLSYKINVTYSDEDVTEEPSELGDSNDVTFTNVYYATGNTQLEVKKTLDGAGDLNGATFKATLQSGTVTEDEADGTMIFTADDTSEKEVTFRNDGSATFGTNYLTYSETGEYWYELTEVIPGEATAENNYNDGTYTYDTTVYYVKVEVTDNHAGSLIAKVTEIREGSPTGTLVEGTVTFDNITTTTYEVVKKWPNDDAVKTVTRPAMIYVQLKRTKDAALIGAYPYEDNKWEDVENVVTIKPDADGNWGASWSGSNLEVYSPDGKPYIYYAFEVDEDEDGNVLTTLNGAGGNSSYTVTTATSSDAKAQSVTNTLDTGTLNVTKKVEGLEVPSKEEYEVTVTLLLNGDTLNGVYDYFINSEDKTETVSYLTGGSVTVRLEQNETLRIVGLPLGTTYTVTENLTDTQSGYYIASYSDAVEGATKTGGAVSKENADAEVTIDNIYNPLGALTLKAAKSENYYNSINDEPRVYKFRLYEIATSSNAYTDVATMSDADKADPDIRNTEIWELASEDNLKKATDIRITDDDLQPVSGAFDKIAFEGYGDEGYHYYLVEEGIPDSTYRTFDTTKYVIEVLVTDGEYDDEANSTKGLGNLVATVTRVWKLEYEADGVTLRSITKEVDGENLDSYTSSFTNRYDADGELTLQVIKQVRYDGELYWLENRGEDVEFTFDLYDLKVSDEDPIDTKIITAKDVAEAGEVGNAKVSFKTLTYDEKNIGQTYLYTVTERAVDDEGYLINTQKYTVKVVITDDGKNNLIATPTYYLSNLVDEAENTEDEAAGTETGEETGSDESGMEAEEPETEEGENEGETEETESSEEEDLGEKKLSMIFTNTYFPKGDVELIISKTLEGAELPAELFAATLIPVEVDENGTVTEIEEETDAELTEMFEADGKASFSLHYDAAGTYWYEVRELIPWVDIPATASNADDGTYTYDTAVYYVKITVTDQHNGKLAAASVEVTRTSPFGESVEVETVEDGITFKSITFENKYTGSKVDVPVTKLWDDYENRYSTRPESITVTLYRDGEKTDRTLVLNDGNGWKDVFTDLDEYDYGNKIVYTVEESSIAGYAGVITGSTAEGYEITNKWTEASPGISIVKTASEKENGTSYKRGEVITYTIVVTNTGNVVLTDVVVTDELTGNSGDNAWKVASMDPGETVTFTATYTVTSADVSAKNVHNEASVTGKDPEGGDVEDEDSADTPVKTTGGSSSHSNTGGNGSSSSSTGTSSSGTGGPGSSGSPSGELVSLTPEEFDALAKTGEGRETEAWMFTSLISGLMLILVALLRRKKDEEE